MASAAPLENQAALLRADAIRLLTGCEFAKDFAGKTVAITGAGGMLGGWVTYLLTQMREINGLGPDRILVLSSGRSDSAPIWSGLVPDGDIRRWSPTDRADSLPSADLFVHLASPASPTAFIGDPQATVLLNTVGTLALLQRARSINGSRVIYVSSSEIYGQAQGLLHESVLGEVPLDSHRWIYAEAKRLGELLCQTAATQEDVDVAIVRPFHTLGPGMSPDDSRVFGEFIRAVLMHQQIVLRGDPSTQRTFCYAGDSALGLLAVAARGEARMAYNLAGSAPTSIGSLAAQLSGEFGLPAPESPDPSGATEGNASNPSSTGQPDITRVQALGWSPQLDALEAFRRTIAYVQAGTAA